MGVEEPEKPVEELVEEPVEDPEKPEEPVEEPIEVEQPGKQPTGEPDKEIESEPDKVENKENEVRNTKQEVPERVPPGTNVPKPTKDPISRDILINDEPVPTTDVPEPPRGFRARLTSMILSIFNPILFLFVRRRE